MARQGLLRVLRRGLRTSIRISEPASVTAALWRDGRRVGRARIVLTEAGRRAVYVRLSKATRRQLAAARRVRMKLRVSATDAAGNKRTVTRVVRLSR